MSCGSFAWKTEKCLCSTHKHICEHFLNNPQNCEPPLVVLSVAEFPPRGLKHSLQTVPTVAVILFLRLVPLTYSVLGMAVYYEQNICNFSAGPSCFSSCLRMLNSSGSRISSRWGCQLPRGRAIHDFTKCSPKNCMKLK